MNTKRLMSSIVAMILVICTLLTSCKTGSTSDTTAPDGTTASPSTTTTENVTTTQNPDGTTASPNLPDDPAANCNHETTVKKNVKAATCAVKGYTGDDVCSSCGIVVNKGTETELIDHVYDNGKVTKEPSCIEQGIFTFTCTGCGTTKNDSLAKVDHKDEYHDALDGTHNHTCEVCTLSNNAAHTPKDAGVLHQADCLSAEYTEHTCSLCNGVYKVYTEGSEPLGCSFGGWSETKSATCSVDGEMTRSCTRCQGVETLAIPKNDASHSYKLVNTFPASCSDEGTERHQCEYCNAAYTVTLQKLPHEYTSVETLDNGWTHKLCDCGYKLSTFDAKNLVEAKIEAADIPEDNSFEVSLEKADIVFPDTVVSQLKDGEGELSIKADVMPESHKNDLINAQGSNLTEDQKNRLADVPVYDFGVTVGGNYLDAFDSEVSVTIPYELKEGEDSEGILVWYVKEDGQIENVSALYNESAKTVTFSVSHFSFYAIAYEETQEMRCKRGNHSYYATPIVVKADCTQHGYTLYECECCHYKNISDIVEKKNHALGDVIQPKVDCTNGGYTHRVCADCGYTVNIDYIRAKGHTPGAAATCETPSVCTECNTVIIPAKSHKYTEWETVKAPTGSEEGIKRRYCTNCGKAEEKAVPPTGLAEKVEFESYGDFYNYLFRDLLRIEGGTLSFGMTQTRAPMSMSNAINLTIANDGTNYSILVERVMSQTNNNVTEARRDYILIRNGMMFEVSVDRDGDNYVYVSASDSLNVKEDLANSLYFMMEEMDYAMLVLFELADAVVTLGELYPEKVNEIFAAADLAVDVAELKQHINTLKAEYSYIASLFAYESALVVPEGVKAGGISNIISVITSLMTNDGNGKYSYLLSSLLDAAEELVNTYDSYAELPVSDALYNIFKDDILAKFPELTTRALVEAKIRESFPGTMKVSEAVDKIMSTVCGNDSAKLESIYSTVNSIAKFYVSSETEFDIEAIILEYADYTLDRFAQENMDCNNFAQVLDMVFGEGSETLFKELFGGYSQEAMPMPKPDDNGTTVVVPSEPTFHENEGITMLREYVNLGKYTDDSKLEITVKDNGLLDAINGKISVDVAVDKDTGETVPVKDINPATPDKYDHTVVDLVLSFKENKNATITLPALLDRVKDQKVSVAYDENGNIVINADESMPDLTFGVDGYSRVDLGSLMVKDNALSAEKGFEIYYPSDREFWENNYQYSNEEFVIYNGILYDVESVYVSSFTCVNAKIALKDLIANPLAYLDVSEDDHDGYVDINGERIPVYKTFAGLVYQSNGEWMLINDQHLDYTYEYENYYDKENDLGYYKQYKLWHDYNNGYIVSARFEDVISSITLSNFDKGYYYDSQLKDENGNNITYKVISACFSVENDLWKEYTLQLLSCIENDGTINVLDTKYVEGRNYRCLGDAADVSQYADWSMYTYTQEYELYDKDLNIISGNFEFVRYERNVKVPVYYAKVGDSFVELAYLRAIPNISYESIDLPDSTKLYVVLADGNTNNGVLYGYTKVADNIYTETACFFENGALTGKVFRYAANSVYRDFHENDISSYITKNGNTYVISADLISDYKNICDGSSDYAYFNLYVRGDDEAADYDYSFSMRLYAYSVDKNDEGQHIEPDWWRAFDNIYYDYYNIKVNDDGSLSFWFGDGSKIDMTLNRDGSWIAVRDELLTKDNDISASTGLDVGSITSVDTWSMSYLYIDGKYYWYNSYNVIKAETASTAEEVFLSTYYIDDVYYRYDFDAGNGKTYKVYQGTVRFEQHYFGSSDFRIFMIVNDDGKLMALSGAEELGESVLEFDGMVAIDDYIRSLELSFYDDKHHGYGNSYINGALRDVYFAPASIYEKDANGNRGKYVGEYGAYYYKVGNTNYFIKKYVNTDHYVNGQYIKKGSLETLPNGVVKIELEECVAYNGVFSIAHVYYTETSKDIYIKIDGTYYNYYSYNEYGMSEEEALRHIGDNEWKYVVWNFNDGNYYLCDLVIKDGKYMTVENIGARVDDFYMYENKWIGKTDDGYEIYELSMFKWPDDITTETRPDGTVFYSRNGENMGLLKCPDGKYFEAERITLNDGTTAIVPLYMSVGEVYVDFDTFSGYLDAYITFSSDDSVVTFSSDILNALEELFGRNIYNIDLDFCFESEDGREYRLSIHELASYLGYNSNGGKYDK